MFIPTFLISLNAKTDLTFVRHAETVANASGKYNSRTLNEFSDLGNAQITALTRQLLAEPRFDRILVSPSSRAMKTILPYLKISHQTADIWPLLYECCTTRRTTSKPTSFKFGAKITLSKDQSPFFRILPGMDRLPVAPDYGSGLAQVNGSVAQFRRMFATGRVLVVGHSGHGGKFLKALTGKQIKVDNAKEIHAKI